MSSNLPFSRYTESGTTGVNRVTGVDREPRLDVISDHTSTPIWDTRPDRLTRRRTLPADEARQEMAVWLREGAVEIPAPEGWTALQRERGDTVDGSRRILRLLIGPGSPASVVNWSVPFPLTPDDRVHWQQLVEASPDDDTNPSGRVPFMGWTA